MYSKEKRPGKDNPDSEPAMKIETLLPLGKVDPGLRPSETPLDIRTVYQDAKLVEELGYDGLVVEETKDDPFTVISLAAQATTRLALGTAVAMAFPRSPTVTAMTAWTIQKLSGGRFTLGLGSQVKGHLERRYGMKWTPPAPWMREYIRALRALWDCWQNGTPLDFQGEHYRLNLVVPLFKPGPIAHPHIPIHVAAVNRFMCRVAGEVANGVRPHPICTPKYISEVMLPEVRKGAAKAQRDATGIAVCMKPLVATAPDEVSLQEKVRDVRARIAFYASTPAYRPAFAIHGYADLAAELTLLSRAQRWEEMPEFITDDMVELYAVVGTYDVIAQRLLQRYGGIATNIEFSIPARNEEERERLREVVREMRGG